jgi:hypothetical protein
MSLRRTALVGLAFLVGFSACIVVVEEPTETAIGEFAIYLPAGNLLLDDEIDLAHVELADIPVLTAESIVWYEADSHFIKLEPSVEELLDALELPGRPFLVTIDRTPIYAGAFMSAYFSRSYGGVVILWPPMDGARDTIRIQLGYPGEDFFEGEDPRSDPRVLGALRQAGKLR